MKVYLVWEGYEDVIAVFSNRDEAERFITEHMRIHNNKRMLKRSRDRYSITGHIVDEPESDGEA